MMFHITVLISGGIGQYGMAIGTSQRADLTVMYTRLAAEVAKYAEKGAKIMIKNGWLEKPPQAPARSKLAEGSKGGGSEGQGR